MNFLPEFFFMITKQPNQIGLKGHKSNIYRLPCIFAQDMYLLAKQNETKQEH